VKRLVETVPRRTLWALAALLALLLAAPAFASPYLLSALVPMLYFASVGQSWNLMMGFAGQLSLGHALYAGLGGYIAAALWVHFGIGPWLGAPVAALAAAATGGVIGTLAFRFRVGGVYFALLTIAFAEFTRIGFEHLGWVGGAGGFFLPVAARADPIDLRGGPALFYYLLLVLTAGLFLLCRQLSTSRIGYYWIAIREDEEAARALGIDVTRCKLLAITLSAALTALGGTIIAFYGNVLSPADAFGAQRSIEMILGPLVGGIGTLFGPLLGAAALSMLGEGLRGATDAAGIQLPGLTQLVYGIVLLLVVRFLPHGIWPALARRLKLDR
jgi:branched-chain amino acid transport system permease protein